MSSFASRTAAGRTGPRLVVLVASVVVVVVVAVIAVGRWERQRWIHEQLAGMRRVQALVGPLDQPALYGYRVMAQFDCLVYKHAGVTLGLELCVNAKGQLIEAIDRTGSPWRYYSLRPEPTASTIHVDRTAVERLLQKMGARTS